MEYDTNKCNDKRQAMVLVEFLNAFRVSLEMRQVSAFEKLCNILCCIQTPFCLNIVTTTNRHDCLSSLRSDTPRTWVSALAQSLGDYQKWRQVMGVGWVVGSWQMSI